MTETANAAGTSDREIVISRVLDAPRERVWEAMADPAQVIHWWGPRGFTTTIEKMDVRPGGVWKHVMHGPDGVDYPNASVFKEVVKPERIVFAHGGAKPGGPGANFVATWSFEALDDGSKTRLTIRMVFPSAQERDTVAKVYGAIEGGKQTLERLSEYLPKVASAPSADFVITRVFDAPRELVFRAWAETERMAQWFGPKGFTTITAKNDPRPGGTYHWCMKSPDGQAMWGKWVYREIVAPERLVFVNSFSDEAGNITRHPWSSDWPLEMLTTVTFAEDAGRTTLTIRWSPLNATAVERNAFDAGRGSMTQGWTGTLDRLTGYLGEGSARPERKLILTRVFDAPRETVFNAWIDPKQMAKWWGPKGFTNPICELDARPGGAIRILMRAHYGVDHMMTGTFREIVKPSRIVFVCWAEDGQGKRLLEAVNSATFEELGSDKTKLTLEASAVGLSPEAPQMLAGMEAGWTQSLERLEATVRAG
jgi:uncharacterized protein YndB with AHSA1/START domain